ncbi:hypothetical protein VLK31_09055 [Variovorax sp. H27-G14]|uniref:hypothetical protein n=1 Tax=Variovorax sp. H27-G14 TaxID=3111914 RepID=UPI0038FCE7CD
MSSDYYLYGRDTSELIHLDQGRGADWMDWSVEQFGGPVILLYLLRPGEKFKISYLYSEHLKLLYSRFAEANPLGVEIGKNSWYERKYPLVDFPENEGKGKIAEKPCVILSMTDEDAGYPHLKKYLPEIFDEEVVAKMTVDPWLDVHLLGEAISKGIIKENPVCSPRWTSDWLNYCDNLRR